jgi:hypothetical protein
MKCAIEMDSGGVICISSFMTIGSAISIKVTTAKI